MPRARPQANGKEDAPAAAQAAAARPTAPRRGAGMAEEPRAADKARAELAAAPVPSALPAGTEGPITLETPIMDIMWNYPNVLPILIEAGLHCVGCQLAAHDSIQMGCRLHGMEDAQIEDLVAAMNAALRRQAEAERKAAPGAAPKKG